MRRGLVRPRESSTTAKGTPHLHLVECGARHQTRHRSPTAQQRLRAVGRWGRQYRKKSYCLFWEPILAIRVVLLGALGQYSSLVLTYYYQRRRGCCVPPHRNIRTLPQPHFTAGTPPRRKRSSRSYSMSRLAFSRRRTGPKAKQRQSQGRAAGFLEAQKKPSQVVLPPSIAAY